MINLDGKVYGDGQLFLIAGPCAVESEEMVLETAGKLCEVCNKLKLPLIFKASYRKANRLSSSSFAGIGDQEALAILDKVRSRFEIPILTDVHETSEVQTAAEVCDILQIPAFLCRQTDLLVAAARAAKAVNIKKGQFLAPEDMFVIAKKAVDAGNRNIMLTERGTSFGYHNLVVDFRSIIEMSKSEHLVVFDATHSVQRPAGQGETSGGNREYILPLAKAALAVGIDGLFFETHPNPSLAKSDAATQLPLADVEKFLQEVKRVAEINSPA